MADCVEWYRCPKLTKGLKLSIIPVIWYGWLFVPELPRAVLTGDGIRIWTPIITAMYILAAAVSGYIVISWYRAWSSGVVLFLSAVLAPFIGVLFFAVSFVALGFVTQEPVPTVTELLRGLLILVISGPVLLVNEAWWLLLLLCPFNYFMIWRVESGEQVANRGMRMR